MDNNLIISKKILVSDLQLMNEHLKIQLILPLLVSEILKII